MTISTDISKADSAVPLGNSGGGYSNSLEPLFFEVDRKKYRLTKTKILILQTMAASQGAPLTRGAISQKAQCCQKTITRCIKLFVRAGLVEVIENHHSNGGQIANSYITTTAANNLLTAYNSRYSINHETGNPANRKQEGAFLDSLAATSLYPSP